MTIEKTLEERGSRYGQFHQGAIVMQSLKDAMHEHPKWSSLPDFVKESLEMIQHKIGRVINGDPLYTDNWHDIVGYAKLVEDHILETNPSK